MNKEVVGEKLLILGGGALMCQIVQKAQSMGIYTIVTDYYSDHMLSPAKQIADESWDINWNDIDILEEKCRGEKVDGVFTGFSEFCVVAARKLCDRLSLPFYATEEQIEITRDKCKFKELCKRFHVPTVNEYELSADLKREQLSKLCYPIVIKPADNAGSRGISVCYNEKEVYAAVDKAIPFSASKTIIVEEYMDCPEVNATYTIQEGRVSLTGLSDAIPGEQKYGQIKLTDGWLYPSKYLAEYVASVDRNVREMIRGIGIQYGTIFVTSFYDKGSFKIFESGFRIGGGTNYHFAFFNNGVDYLEMMLVHALTGKAGAINISEKDDPFFKCFCCNLTIMAKPGEIAHVGGLEKIREMPGVLSLNPFYCAGQQIPDSGALSQTFLRSCVAANSAKELAERIHSIYEVLELRDTDGNDMVLSRLNKNSLTNYWGN